ncbi:uncharacterized protein LOC128207837 [Mya arenaria]|uniref:uncharacterized protein LOC128207837 n=1 Tax=Mya arenaria TaxID=6604 RepID=UPI0022E5B2F5|nr:uncharacterized protein LOC128207837 [Mya arenaria]XP_052766959.1 uncharacterized protein LOC128207837 [Mya arenaria]XP_052766960.1 uncharacterized protein LOC128207837 [Mya arenaria]XP_052766961.1 uncharacterized protein LOC128207837 [Mya arenaria]
MAEYKVGDLSKLFGTQQKSEANIFSKAPTTNNKKNKETEDAVKKTKKSQGENVKKAMSFEKVKEKKTGKVKKTKTEKGKKIEKVKTPKINKKMFGAQLRLKKKQKNEGVSDSTDIPKQVKKRKTTAEKDVTESKPKKIKKQSMEDSVNKPKKGRKKKIMEKVAKSGSDLDNENVGGERDIDNDVDESDEGSIDGGKENDGNQTGFCPAGIVHESLVKHSKKRKQESVSGSEDESSSPSKKSKTEDEEKEKPSRKRRDRLAKPTLDRTVFVGNLALNTSKKTLEKAFKDCGEIESIRYRCVPVNDPSVPKKVIAIKKDFHPERHNCVGFICFKTNEAAEKALELNGHELKGLHIRVDWASKDKEKDVKKSVFVGNLPFDVEEEAVRNHFEDCGKITNVRLIRDKKTCIGKGFGYVTFEDKDGVGFAMKLSGQKLKGRELRVMACSSSAGHEKKHKQVKLAQSPGLKEKKQKTKQQLPSNPSKTAFKGEESKKEKTKKKDKKSYSKKIKVPFKTITKDDGLKADIQALIDSETKKGGESTKEPKMDKKDKKEKMNDNKIKTADTGEENKVENREKAFTKAQSSSNGKADLEKNKKFEKKVNAIKPGKSDGKADKFEKKQTFNKFDKKGFGKQENSKFGNKMNKSFGGFDKRGGKPFENKGSKPFESRGGKPFENRSGKQFPNRGQKSFDIPGNSSFSGSGNKSFDSNPGKKPFHSTPRPGFSSKPLSGLVQGSGKHIKFD